MKPLSIMAAVTFLASACGGKNAGDGDGDGDEIVIEGEAFTLVLQPVMPEDQAALFDEIGTLEIKVTQGDGTTSTHPLSDDGTEDAAAVLPPLEGATLALSGKKGAQVILWGQTPPIDLSEGDHTQRITLAKVDTLAQLEDLPVGLGFGAVAAGLDGRFYLFGGVDEGVLDQDAETSIYEVDIGTPGESLRPAKLSLELPALSDVLTGRLGLKATTLTQDTELQGQILLTGGTGRYLPLQDGTYIWAGEQGSSLQAYLFDSEQRTLTEVSGFDYPRYAHVAVENHLGEVVVIGGFNDQTTLLSQGYAEVFDPTDRAFHQVSGLITTGTAFHAAARLGEQGVMSCGGISYTQFAATQCALISTDRVLSAISWPGKPVVSPAMVTMADDRILLTGGLDMTDVVFDLFDNELQATSDAWVFQSGAWQPVSPMNHPRAWHTALPLPDGRVLITGGVSEIVNENIPGGSLYLGTVYQPNVAMPCAEIFDPETNTFTELDPCDALDASSSLPEPLLMQGGAVDPEHGALLMGGQQADGYGSRSVMLYRPSPD